MTPTLTYTGTLQITTCWCGIALAMPVDLYLQAKRHGKTCWCPLGHKFVFSDTDDAKIDRLEKRLQATRDLVHAEERSHAATRGHLTRARKKAERVAAGVCPCCNRTFQNLARHMHGQHPDYPAHD